VAQGAETTLAPEHSPTEPGFYRVNCEFALDGEGDPLELSTILGYRPEELASPSTREADFDDFWRDTLGELATVKPRFRMKRTPERDTATHEVYEVKMRSLGDVRLGGWYEMPREGERFAAVMRVPGYSGAMMPSGRPELVAILSFNPRAHGNSQKDVPHDPQDYWVRGLDDKQGYFYQGAYADCVRGVDFLASRPEVDASRIAVTGGSQGGGLTLATAALDPRISACAPDIAFLCNWEKYFRATKWPEIDGWIAAEGHRSWAKMLRTLSYVDAMNMAGRITCPAFFSMGLQDPTCPPATIFGVYNRLDVAKEYRVYADAGHWVPDEHSAAKWKWMLEQLGVELVDEPN
ncbi:MAG TPA: acetylxylan esterase, partial [Armatimonadota bacterium]|nr:acetylxylan esterase [Armatimonadota bacterium]